MKPLTAEELHGRNGQYKDKRRPARKIYCDLQFLMKYIIGRVESAGSMPDNITPASVDEMFLVVAPELSKGRNAQKNWQTVAGEIRRKQQGKR
jgi:hypothetical protein